MTAKQKSSRKSPTRRRTKEEQQVILDELAEIDHALLFHEPLSQPHRLLLMRVLRELLDGRDPRVELGIPPKRGVRPMKRGYHVWMAGHYWHLRLRVNEKETVARSAVAQAWGVSASQVWKVARPLRKDWQTRFATGEFNNIMNAVESFIPHYRQLPNSR